MTDSLLKERMRSFMESEGKSCSFDPELITPEYVYRMWGGKLLIEDEYIENGFAESHFVGNKRVTEIGIHGNLN